jgi:alginate O-acetyltransferase complex protein AlgI
MRFDRPIFLFGFLPLCLALYAALSWLGGALARKGFPEATRALQNLLLLLASLIFYAWGEVGIVFVMLGSIAANYLFGLLIGSFPGRARAFVAVSVVFNLGLLVFYKYANFLWDNARALLDLPPLDPIHLPIGISFFTFHCMSYVLDVYRRDAPTQRNPVNFALYIALFPQLIAGPIVRYRQIAGQLTERQVRVEDLAAGIRRFVIGLAKKLLVADVLGRVADSVFAIPSEGLTAPLAWLGICAYALQIYFDFSGYSDMAIGLARMFGFHFPENFNYPYVSASVTEFWRRWHISLSSWFRDYLYIPLGGNRLGAGRTLFNLVLVFFLCGLWHGASWTFVVWGLYHGAFLVLERIGLRAWVARAGPLAHAYTLLVVVAGWVFFRAETLDHALGYLSAMAGAGQGDGRIYHAGLYLDAEVKLALIAGLIGSAPLVPAVLRWREQRAKPAVAMCLDLLGNALVLVLLFAAQLQMAASTYQPFIYFRF